MKVFRILKWTPVILAGIFVISSQYTSQDHSNSQKPIKLSTQGLKENIWVSVDQDGKQKIIDHQTCELIFLEDQYFELRRTFEYSGSTFRTPGKYSIEDSTIHLKNLTGSTALGKACIFENHHLRIKWDNSNTVYGKGIETFRTKRSCKKKSINQQLSAGMQHFSNKFFN